MAAALRASKAFLKLLKVADAGASDGLGAFARQSEASRYMHLPNQSYNLDLHCQNVKVVCSFGGS